jgi:DNA-binding GntR family transcriptional regulator
MDDPRPAYVQLADALRRAVAKGTYPPGSRIPSVRTLAEEYAVASATAAKALDVLKREGVLAGRTGYGTFVRDTPAVAAGSIQEQLDDLRQRVEVLERAQES